MKKSEQLLAEGYQSMAELNLMISYEQFELECEACEKSDRFFTSEDGE
ncbi:antitoxin MazE [Macrococcus lamae]|uniref:Antitoxin MazE n=1 Tax=Macrococcus lamae TaxID=198484 RepID=A0A4V3BEV6_9STAP|nr:antitoxin MazE [Macrococcus lamae]TDM10487.1 antitoxin MazE [Macrococcus lamae]